MELLLPPPPTTAMRIQSLPWLDANAAWALLVAGLLLIYWELCRPGSVVPGALGGVCALVALARFAGEPGKLAPAAVLWFLAGWAALAAEAWWRWPGPPGLAGAVLLTLGAMAASVRWYVALPLSAVLGAATAVLGSAAIRAFLAKRIS